MAQGNTVQEARKMILRDLERGNEMLLTPFYGCGTSDETYKAIVGSSMDV